MRRHSLEPASPAAPLALPMLPRRRHNRRPPAPAKLEFVISRTENLAYQVNLDLDNGQGKIVTNLSLIPRNRFPEALALMKDVFRAGYSMSDLVCLHHPGHQIEGICIPEDMFGFETVCSIALNGLLLKQGIPVESRYGGVLEIRRGNPWRFTDLVSYAGSTLDPTEVLLLGHRTSVLTASLSGSGRILASFREVPAVAGPDLEALLLRFHSLGLRGLLALGRPGQPLLEIPVGLDRIGLAVIAGLTPVAALVEANIPVINKPMAALTEFSHLLPIWDL